MTYISLFSKSLAELHIISYILETKLMLNLCEVKYTLHLFKEGHLLYIVDKYIERNSIVFLSSIITFQRHSGQLLLGYFLLTFVLLRPPPLPVLC